MVPQGEINHCMEQITDELCNVGSKFNKLTDYILNNYIGDARFPFHIWNHFDSIDERLRTNNHLEGYHRPVFKQIETSGHELIKFVDLKNLLCVAMNKFKSV